MPEMHLTQDLHLTGTGTAYAYNFLALSGHAYAYKPRGGYGADCREDFRQPPTSLSDTRASL